LRPAGPGHASLRRDHPDRQRKAVSMITILLIILVILLLTGGGIGMRRRGR
jgi:flagellar basal body-associated protein FliL